MHILIGAFLLLVINIGYVAGTRKWLKKVSQKHKNIVAAICLITFFASVPLLSSYLYSGHDLPFHLLRIEGVKDA